MTTIVRRPASVAVDARGALARLFDRPGEADWARPAFAGVTLLAAFLYIWNLTVSGFANEYYSMAAQAASQSWTAWFFGSLDASNFITVDKPPLATMLMGLSVRLFGLSSASILLPEALLGVATVALLFIVVRRSFGAAAATIAGLVMALTPAAVLIFRYDNPDALLTFLLVASAGALLHSIESGRRRWLVLAGVLVGAAFLTKYLQAYLVMPAFALAYLVSAPGSLRRRIVDIVGLGVVALAASGWWVAIVQLVPAASRPYVGGSTGNSVLDLIFGYDGLGRIFGAFGFGTGGGSTGGGNAGGGAGFGGTPGILRMFNSRFAGQISWFLPYALIALVVGTATRLRAGRSDRRLAAYLLWGGWLLVTVLVFSFMSGVIHSYYTVALAPAIAALVGAGTVAMWRLRERTPLGGLLLAGAFLVTAGWAYVLLGWTPSFAPGLGIAVVAVALAAAIVLAAPGRWVSPRIALSAATIGLAVLMAAPAAYATDTMQTAYSGGDPSAGPSAGRSDAFGGGIPGAGRDGTSAGSPMFAMGGTPPSGLTSGVTPPAGMAGPAAGGTGGGPGEGASLDQAAIDYLVANRGTASWLVAVASSNEAAPIQLATGIPVMAMGGFNGSDSALTVDQLQAYVASGTLRYVLVGGGGGPGGSSSSSISQWVTSACAVATDASGATVGDGSLYDCSPAASVTAG